MSDPPVLRVESDAKVGHTNVMTGIERDQQTGQTDAMTRTPSDQHFGQMDAGRRESGVFLSPQNSRDADSTHGLCPEQTRVQLDSGYRSGQSESSVLSHDQSPRMARFYVPDHAEDSGDTAETILLDSDDHHGEGTAAAEDDVCSDDEDLDTCGPSPSRTAPVNIPAASIHEAQGRMLRLMEATPPRTYLQHGSPHETYHAHHRYSTGCLSLSPVVISALRQCHDSQTTDCLRQSIRVTSGRLHASKSRASLAQRRKSDAPLPPLELIDEHNLPKLSPRDISPRVPRISRDRSQSAPDITSVIVQRQCAQELRRISDDFFADFHGKRPTSKGRPERSVAERTQSQSVHEHSLTSEVPTLPSSFPGTGQKHHSSSWWQSVVQSIAPSHIRRPSAGTFPQH